jgi:thiol-disulfide isomerase/thioredoxin
MNANKRIVNKIILLIAAAVVFSTPAAAIYEGDVAPAWEATTFQGETYSYPDVTEDKPTVIIFWASWCSYCKAFMPYLKKIEQEYGTDFIEIVAINMKEEQEGESDPGAYIQNTGIDLTAIQEGDEVAAAYNVRFVPGLMVVGGDGTVVYRRSMTKLPAGQKVAELWYEQVREALDVEFETMAGC